jgi:hypothetical protein
MAGWVESIIPLFKPGKTVVFKPPMVVFLTWERLACVQLMPGIGGDSWLGKQYVSRTNWVCTTMVDVVACCGSEGFGNGGPANLVVASEAARNFAVHAFGGQRWGYLKP